ncbi:MAG: hypothetical protein JWO67_3818 [Streptosporangiaceae bacterium]|nr:hypothetical protein [Streptosporangiaceae bacterium]
MKDRPPLSVYREAGGTPTWRWTCHVRGCQGHDWHPRRQDALDAGLAHLKGHATFGFRRR